MESTKELPMQQYTSSATIESAYEHCRQIAWHCAKTFYWGTLFLPQPKRHAIWAIYAFCRLVDDTVDLGLTSHHTGHNKTSAISTIKQDLYLWRQKLERLYQSDDPGGNIVLLAWQDMRKRYNVPLRPALELLDGVETDLTTKRYQTFDELYLYCYRVAGTVGLMSTSIFGYRDEHVLKHAVELGIAFQLTNILRDIGEDIRNDRIYLPLDEMERFAYREHDLMAGVINDNFLSLMHFQIKRIQDYYTRARQGISLLDADAQLAVLLSQNLYSKILDRIRRNRYQVFLKRAHVPLHMKLVITLPLLLETRIAAMLRLSSPNEPF
jgi:phytoene synthase